MGAAFFATGFFTAKYLYPLSKNRLIACDISDTAINMARSKYPYIRFDLAALYGHREEDIMDGVTLIDPLDVLDCSIEHHRAGALVLNTWTL